MGAAEFLDAMRITQHCFHGHDTAAKSTQQQSLQLAPRLRPTCAGITFKGRVDFLMKLIPLTRGQFAIVDDEDYEWISKWNWQADKLTRKKRPPAYYARTHPTNSPKLHMHRMILERMGFTNISQGDHRDGNSLNNRRENLRPASNAQNNANKVKLPGFSSRFKGVSWDRARNKWSAELTVNDVHYHLGRFESEESAAKAYDAAALIRCGEFAKLNFQP